MDDKGKWIFHTYDEVCNSGNWIVTVDFHDDAYECSECGTIIERKILKDHAYRFCPYCGKRMERLFIR